MTLIFVWKDKLLIYFLLAEQHFLKTRKLGNWFLPIVLLSLLLRETLNGTILWVDQLLSVIFWPDQHIFMPPTHHQLLLQQDTLSCFIHLQQLRQTTCTLSSLRKTDLSSTSFYFTLPLLVSYKILVIQHYKNKMSSIIFFARLYSRPT